MPSRRIQSQLHAELLKHLVAVRKAVGLSLVEACRKAGLSKQTFNGWQHGSSPTVESLEGWARAVGGRLYVRILTQADRVTDPSQPEGTPLTDEAAEVAALIDGQSDGQAREAIKRGAYAALSEYYRGKTANPLAPGAEPESPRVRR